MRPEHPRTVRPVSAGRAPDDVGVALLAAAHRVLATDGPFGLTVRRVAQEAGVSTMNVYSRYGGKDGLVDQLFIDGFTRMTAQMMSQELTDDPMDDLRRCSREYRRFALENPTYYMVMFDTIVPDWRPSDAAEAVAMSALAGLAAQIQRAIDAGQIDAVDAHEIAVSFWATSHGVISLEMRMGPEHDFDWAAIYDTTCDRLREGFRARPRGAEYRRSSD
jgi:AcrR family transcriptional regulator